MHKNEHNSIVIYVVHRMVPYIYYIHALLNTLQICRDSVINNYYLNRKIYRNN